RHHRGDHPHRRGRSPPREISPDGGEEGLSAAHQCRGPGGGAALGRRRIAQPQRADRIRAARRAAQGGATETRRPGAHRRATGGIAMKPFTSLACLLLGMISVLQLARVLLGWEIVVNGMSIPLWSSGVACVVAGTLALMTWREARRCSPGPPRFPG